MPIIVNKKRFGTINFSSLRPRAKKFDEMDIDFIRLIGHWASKTLEEKFNRAQIEVSKDVVEKASVDKNIAISKISHEIRNKLHGVLYYSNRGQKCLQEKSINQVQDYLSKIDVCGGEFDSDSKRFT